MDALSELRFLYGEQWTSDELAERQGRPSLTLNKLPAFVDQVVGDQRQNKISIQVHPVHADSVMPQQADGAQLAQPIQGRMSNLEGTKDYTNAEVLAGLIRNIEVTSDADSHYSIAYQHAVESGFGWLRVFTEYSGDDWWNQDIRIKSIRNRFAVLIDPKGISEPDFSSANWGFIMELMRRKEFMVRYPDANTGDLAGQVNTGL